jgi:hypothetical protein
VSYDSWKLASPPEEHEPDDGDDSEWQQRFDRAREMAVRDALADLDPQELTGELAEFQDEYDDAYTEALLEKQQPKN